MAPSIGYALDLCRPSAHSRTLAVHDYLARSRLEVALTTEPAADLTADRAMGLLTAFAAYLAKVCPDDLNVRHEVSEFGLPVDQSYDRWHLQVGREPVIVTVDVKAWEDLALEGESPRWARMVICQDSLHRACILAAWKLRAQDN